MPARGGSVVSTLDATHPVRPDLGLCVAPICADGGCRARCPDAELLRATFHIMVLCRQGAASQVIDFREQRHHPGSLLWIPPGVVHERTPAFQGSAVCFTSAFLGSGLAELTEAAAPSAGTSARPAVPSPNGAIGGSWNLQGDDLADIDAMIHVLGREYLRLLDSPTGIVRVRGDAMLRHLLIALIERVQAVPRERDASEVTHPLVRRFIEMVELHFSRLHTVEDFAAVLGCSTRTLQRLCYEEIGVTPRQFIDVRVAEESERLLTLSQIPIAAVARTVGFADAANFSKFFQRQTGQTPGAFRRAMARVGD